MVKGVSCCCVRGRRLFSNLVTIVVGPRAEVFTVDAGCSFLAVLTGGQWLLNSFKYCRNIASGKGCMIFNPVDNYMCNIWLQSNNPVWHQLSGSIILVVKVLVCDMSTSRRTYRLPFAIYDIRNFLFRMVNKDSKYNVAIVILHGIATECRIYVQILVVCMLLFFQLLIRVARYACMWLATTTALCKVITLT